jgi:hypothetical protein
VNFSKSIVYSLGLSRRPEGTVGTSSLGQKAPVDGPLVRRRQPQM